MVRLSQSPAPGEHFVRFVGDALRFELRADGGDPWPAGWQARLRTNLGRATAMREEIIAAVEKGRPQTPTAWHDVPMERHADGCAVTIPLAEVGWFRAKAYAIDARGWQHWPEGPDCGVNVQPQAARTGNLIYCAWPRLLGPGKTRRDGTEGAPPAAVEELDRAGYTVIPPSGKLRDLIGELPHIFDTLGCRILHLLPVNPTPTTYARFGRFGSPYAGLDLLAIDPALVEFDRRTTGVDQFRELTRAVHARGGRVFLDVVVNHTGWGSTLQERHPDWFLRNPDGTFASPGAWGNTWEDLVELEHANPGLRQYIGEVLIEWCRRGVDGFRCDAGYMVPLPVWQYVTARVRQEFPDTIFLLEGLGGSWEDTEALLTEGGLQWGYSELFQNYSGAQVSGYLDHALRQSGRAGLLIHYSETHDNPRLAARGREWSLLRNRLCGLTSVCGGFGFTCGVEWLAPEKIDVHSSRGLAWENPDNLVAELGRLNRLLRDHPCFFDGAEYTRLSGPASPIYALRRRSAEGVDTVWVLVNTDLEHPHKLTLPVGSLPDRSRWVELLGQHLPKTHKAGPGLTFELPAAAAFCLAETPQPRGLSGEAYRRRRAAESLALEILSHHLPVEEIGAADLSRLGAWVRADLEGFLSAATYLAATRQPPNQGGAPRTGADRQPAAGPEPEASLAAAAQGDLFARLSAWSGHHPRVVVWRLADRTRVTPIPPEHWLVIEDDVAFRASLTTLGVPPARHVGSVSVDGRQVACLPPRPPEAATVEGCLTLERYEDNDPCVQATVVWLSAAPAWCPSQTAPDRDSLVLLTNGRGGMARLRVGLGGVQSKYDCLLGANLHPTVPVDRHVFAKRARVWVNADGFLSPLDADNLVEFDLGPPARWTFLAHAGDGRRVTLELRAGMIGGRNTTVLRFRRVAGTPRVGRALPAGTEVRLTVRVDLEDRGFHQETQRNPAADHHFRSHCRPIGAEAGLAARLPAAGFANGFEFTPAADRQLRAWADRGVFHPQPEWCERVPHPIEANRGQVSSGDAYSPGWFELPLAEGAEATVVVCADPTAPTREEIEATVTAAEQARPRPRILASPRNAGGETVGHSGEADPVRTSAAAFVAQLDRAARAFVVRRGEARTVIAGYPWFLDWGRDTLIAARGLLAAGFHTEVISILECFGRLERGGTLPNSLHGEDASNRETSDAPLWYGLACEELAALEARQDPAPGKPTRPLTRHGVYARPVEPQGRKVLEVLRSIAVHYLRGTQHGVRVDPGTGLVWSPGHFTWMDTNHPACTPREGYPVSIQALWVRLLRQLARLGVPAEAEPWAALAERAERAIERLFWLESRGWFADVLRAAPGQSAAEATPDDALRSNMLLLVSLGLVSGKRAQRCVQAAARYLLVPGALRSLAPLPVSPPLPIYGRDGRLLNDPHRPYWGRYEGDEDTRRKPAYHNGTAWTWTYPTFCEALAQAWDFAPGAVSAARAYLGAMDRWLRQGCLGHLPEVVDGDAPHTARGCDAQAWSVTETLRVWARLNAPDSP